MVGVEISAVLADHLERLGTVGVIGAISVAARAIDVRWPDVWNAGSRIVRIARLGESRPSTNERDRYIEIMARNWALHPFLVSANGNNAVRGSSSAPLLETDCTGLHRRTKHLSCHRSAHPRALVGKAGQSRLAGRQGDHYDQEANQAAHRAQQRLQSR